MKKAFVIGWPIEHSKSPLLHGHWLEKYQIDGSYDAVAVAPEELSSFLSGLPDGCFAGGNITLPHKEQAFELISDCDEAASRIGAVNTVWVEAGRLKASNTDAYGFAANLDAHAVDWRDGQMAIVMGAGGASRAIVYALAEAGYKSIRIVNRTLKRAEQLAEHFGSACSAHSFSDIGQLLGSADLLVNTTSIGMSGSDQARSPQLEGLNAHAIVTDIVYTPLTTPLLSEAEERGNRIVDGLGMLLHQAVPGFEKWFGIRPEVTDQLRKTILDAR